MTKLLRPAAALAAVIGAASLGAWAVCSDPEPPPRVAVKATAKPAALKCAVEPKALSETVKKGLTFLAAGQQEDGGWTQGGGWRTGDKGGGRVEGQAVADPSDVGNTCLVLLAFFRAGHTATEGEYQAAVKKGLAFVFDRVEKADGKDLYVTDVRNTQLQSKIGPFADTFLATLMLSELKGHAGPDDARLAKCLDKALDKMAKNQQADGTFAGNGGWAPVLSQGVANKALARARQNGATVNDELIARATTQSRAAAKGSEMAMGGGPAAGRGVSASLPAGPDGAGFGGGGIGVGRLPGGDAGVPLYGRGQAGTNLQDVVNSANADAAKAKEVIADPKAPQAKKDEAQKTLDGAAKLNTDNNRFQLDLAKEAKDGRFVAGFGSNGGEEFLSFLNLSETMLVRGGKDWTDWDGKMQEMLPKAQDKNGSWSGHHCITGKTFCTASALLVLMADRTQFPEDVLTAARAEAKKDAAKAAAEKKPEVTVPDAKKPDEKK